MKKGDHYSMVSDRGWVKKIAVGFFAPAGLWAVSTGAQELPIDPSNSPGVATQTEGLRDLGRTADTGTGAVGQRQTATIGVPSAKPMGRINSRIPNRVQNRLRNRIDRSYDPTANTTSPFEAADDRVRESGRAGAR